MNAVVSRMIWKEFYALRMVWIMCVLGVLALNGIITVYAAAYHWRGFATVFWALAMVVPAAYVVACTAMTFAGEREDRTADWLVALSPPFASLYVSKQLFLVVSGLAMQVFLAAAAASFSFADRTPRYGSPPLDYWHTLGVMEFVFLECVVWGTFWSLQTAKPVQAIFQTIATLIVIFVVSGFSMDLARQHSVQSVGHHGLWATRSLWYGAFDTWGWLRTTWTVGIVAASWALGQRWLNGRAFEWEAVFGRLFQRRVPKARAMATERAEPWQRTWQRLWWLERQSLRTFGWMTLAAAVLSLPTILFGRQPTLAWMVSFCCLLILTGGLLSWRGEQTRQQYRFLVNYGVSPVAIWANKLLMWLLATLIALAVVALPTLGFWQFLSSALPQHTLGYGPKWPRISLSTGMHNQNPQVMWDAFAVVGYYGLMMFAAAFTWSLLSRKAVIAFGLALVTLCLLTPWYGVVTQLGMPMWAFLAPLPVWLVWISWRHVPAWWLERTGWRVWLARCLELVLVPAVLMLGAIVYRVYEIPWIPDEVAFPQPNTPRDGTFAANNAAAWNRVVAAMRALPPYDDPTVASGMMAMPVAPGQEAEPPAGGASAAVPENGPTVDPFDQWLAANQPSLQELRTAVLSTHGLMNPESAIWNRINFPGAYGKTELGLRALARQAVLTVPIKTREVHEQIPTPEGQPPRTEVTTETYSESIEWLRAAVWLGGALECYAPLNLHFNSRKREDLLFAEMIAWAQHPDQTTATLQLGLTNCAADLRLWRKWAGDKQTNVLWEPSRSQDRAYWPWEEARRQRLLQIAAINRNSYLFQVQSSRYPASLHPDNPRLDGPRRTAWEVEPGEERVQNSYLSTRGIRPVVGLDAQTITFLHDTETRYRATIATMAVVGYRRLHGRLPVSLTEAAILLGTKPDATDILRDPWSRAWFQYEPAGFPLHSNSSAEPLKKPLLWSGGPYHYQIRLVPDGVEVWSSMSGTRVAGTITERDTRGLLLFPIPPQTP